MAPEIDKSVCEFIREHIGSVIELEGLLLLSRDPSRSWTAAEVARELRITADWTQEFLTKLRTKGLLRERPGRVPAYAFDGSSYAFSQTVSRLAQAYARQRISVVELIYSKPDDEILTFADAFKFWKKQ